MTRGAGRDPGAKHEPADPTWDCPRCPAPASHRAPLRTWLRGDVLRAARQLPAGPDEVAGVPVGVVLEVILVLGLGFPERPGRGDFGDHLPRPQAGGVDVGDGVLGDLLLLVAEVEDR